MKTEIKSGVGTGEKTGQTVKSVSLKMQMLLFLATIMPVA